LGTTDSGDINITNSGWILFRPRIPPQMFLAQTLFQSSGYFSSSLPGCVMTRLSRRQFLRSSTGASLALAGWASTRSWGAQPTSAGIELLRTTQIDPEGFFRLGRHRDRTWLIDPSGQRFFSIGFNHIDPASLRYPENIHIWREKYDNNVSRWLAEKVRPDLESWGFNSIGNTVEMASNGPTNHRQSRRFTVAEYQSLGLPYCHQLDFADFHHWDAQHRLPDFFASEFEDWCDHVAREYCATMAEDPKLIGYFYMDCPGWVHTHPHSRWRGPMFDHAQLETEAGRKELFDLATQYYRVTHDAVRRYDKHHLILGDRYEGRGRMAEEVLLAAKPYVDVLSFQHFGDPGQVERDLTHWSVVTGLPTLLADSGKHLRQPDGNPIRRHDAGVYAELMQVTRDLPHCVGFHLCGAYQQNRIRHTGFLRPDETPDEPATIAEITRINRETLTWMQTID
jgi:hypothetical protein